jgi:hypothetical protein
MSPEIQLPALAATLAGAMCFYLSAPRQQWLARPWPALAGRVGGGTLLLLAWLWWSRAAHPVAALFGVLTLAMAAFTALPAIVALLAQRRRS